MNLYNHRLALLGDFNHHVKIKKHNCRVMSLSKFVVSLCDFIMNVFQYICFVNNLHEDSVISLDCCGKMLV